MGVLARLFGLEKKADDVKPLSLVNEENWPVDVGDAGEAVTARSSLGMSSVWACANLISGSISSLPCQVYRDVSGVRQADNNHPLYRVVHDSPNYDQTALDFWDFMCLALEMWGNAYAHVIRRDGQIVALRPIRPDLVSVRRLSTGPLEYTWTQDGKHHRVQDRDVFHVRGPGGDPLGGMSTLTVARQSFSTALAAERSAASMFRNGLRPSGLISFKEWLSPEQRKVFDDDFNRRYFGAINAGKPIRIEGGMEFHPLSINPEDAQMLETRQFSVEEICRFFGVPPVMIGHSGGSTAWPTSVEQQVLIFQKFTLRRRLKRIEQAISQQLLTAEDRISGVVVEFNLEGLLRGDSAARASFYTSMTNIGAMTINDVRRLENLPPVDGGDVPRMQMQNVPITQAGEEKE